MVIKGIISLVLLPSEIIYIMIKQTLITTKVSISSLGICKITSV